jgi:hypothetical protein
MAGYYHYSKSNNAVIAERNGIYPATKAAKIYGFKSGKDVRSLIISNEWHHSSKRYNTVDYYDVPEAIRNICTLKEINKWLPKMTKIGRESILDRAQIIIRDNLLPCECEIVRLKSVAGYFKDRKRNIKRKFF